MYFLIWLIGWVVFGIIAAAYFKTFGSVDLYADQTMAAVFLLSSWPIVIPTLIVILIVRLFYFVVLKFFGVIDLWFSESNQCGDEK